MAKRFISFASIVDSVYRGTEYEVIPWQDVAEDIISVLRLIGVPMSYMEKTTNGQGVNPTPIIIENFKGEIPMDVAIPGPCRRIRLNSDAEIIGFSTMIETQDVFYQTPTQAGARYSDVSDWSPTIESTSLDLKMDEAQDQINSGNVSDAADTMEDILNDIDRTKARVSSLSESYPDRSGVYKYRIENGIMYTNFKNGFIEMAYLALPVDEFGMPMVPDEERFIQAVKYYIISRLDFKRWRTTANPNHERIYRDSEREYLWYVGAARTKHKIPSYDMMESIKNMILRSVVKINEHRTGFKNTNSLEQRNF